MLTILTRTTVVLTTLVAGLAFATSDYVEERTLTLDTSGISVLDLVAGAGSLEISGIEGLSQIEVEAEIVVPGRNDEKALKKIESDMVLYLEKNGDKAALHSYFDDRSWGFRSSPAINLTVRMPVQMHLDIDDGSGGLEVKNVRGDIKLEDGSGSITLQDVGGRIDIEDGSGSLTILRAGGDVSINDGSGSIEVRGVAGSVVIDDGSGGIDVSDVEVDLIIEDDGSGGLNFSDIRGRIEKDS